MKKYIVTGLISAALISCGTANTLLSTANQPSLNETHWQLADNVKGKIPTLNVQEGRITGTGGCNNYFGELATEPGTGTFAATKIGSTKMACEAMETETSFFNMLSKVNKYRVSGNTLELYQNGLLLLKFNRMQ
ncbi:MULTISPECIES: META domain-containing protein [Chryseobacterium group]|uniref:META domain-containing protein n=1 Tax=Chryseobacterium group TaxID=2782232 RepID=UPI0012A789E2|nr:MULTISPECIES: META domain-containing protein [Chryseobacterium group]MDF0720683.1 META domain-containing protein [Kaistella sp. PBT33-4]QFG53004.1 META domain-containing protein [Chryseobacterium sp.]